MSNQGENLEVDITGTMVKPLEGWQMRVEALAKPEFFTVKINPKAELLGVLSPEEKARLFKKLKMVAKAAECMAAGMLKGTLKYPTDNYDLRQWIAHLIGEGADQMNYQILTAYAFWALMEQRDAEDQSGVHRDALPVRDQANAPADD